ncbi:hypothetical protein GXW83_06575 [Streptacidiphilus sp. PB12-B1b]|uniref:hypothetical protein n=1 Tax=Streptacidiphilus sp. PB12-B1b TaxID=2705012 RepID=UPI0015F8ADD4|nr:hypothetical protein [Streptacidiphilus sp. PB12-B1b]QMU75460.1 hypothetical protein GXW83_06575 [Streptacidiphilus sp. PB12-B1b]
MPVEGRIPAAHATAGRNPATAGRVGGGAAGGPRGPVAEGGAGAGLRAAWLLGTLLLTLGALVGAALLAPADGAAPGPALGGLLFLGSSVHVATTAWFYTVPEVRRHVAAHRGRYVTAPLALVLGTALLAAAVPAGPFDLLLLAYFGWQFFHFQKQNLGLAALARSAYGGAPLAGGERRAITAAGLAGIAGLLSHPALLQLGDVPRVGPLFPVAAGAYALALGYGVVQLMRRAPEDRRGCAGAVYLTSLLFFLPVFLFRSPYAAVAGMTVAHGYQYLLVVGLVAGGGGAPRAQRLVSLAVLLNLGLVLGLGLNLASHLHTGGRLDRAVYGAYLGAVMGHFVVDAGLWKLRDDFPRTFLGRRLPYLLGR